MTEGKAKNDTLQVEAPKDEKVDFLAEPIKNTDEYSLQTKSKETTLEIESPKEPVGGTCIFKLPRELIDKIGTKYHEPQIISIGPYHNNRHDNLKVMDDHKIRFNAWKPFESEDLIQRKLWALSALYKDLLLLENQIPFVVPTKLFMTSLTENLRKGSEEILINLSLQFFNKPTNISKYFMRYTAFLDFLLNTKEDVDLLYERKVIEHSFETDEKLATYINALGKDLLFGFDNSYLSQQDDFDNLSKMFNEINAHYRSGIRWKWADFKREYCNKPWLLISAFVALVYLLLTFGQTFIAIYAYVHPKKYTINSQFATSRH
ncbi:hypothetical protein CJ030_MR1G001443 [Morella rubra]|uniref:Uncharacterized protein n=1 Tax=Morella rubra TaxID=262757 RepID=A0A6A1WRY4_9ROSI|nr:hypothetical protein CJ030_MR1G001443 [Morella rubra]